MKYHTSWNGCIYADEPFTEEIIDFIEELKYIKELGVENAWEVDGEDELILLETRDCAKEQPIALSHIIEKVLSPNGYVLNGKVFANGEDRDDVWGIEVVDNVIYYLEPNITYERSSILENNKWEALEDESWHFYE